MFIDEAVITLTGGHGGAGKMSFYRGRTSGPDGGNGGRGGDVYLVPTGDIMALSQFSSKKIFEAQNGGMGGSNKKTGANGSDLEIRLPVGSEITDLASNESFEITDPNQRILVCKGGKGGKGNFELKSPTLTTPRFAQKGLKGEKREFSVNLKLIADFGLIGLPNAGKSSLLNELTAANVKVGDYPFTTLEPNLGVLDGKVLADIPGLIEGASSGKGLGIKFLKHIERVKLLIHCVSSESEDILRDYEIVRDELKNFDPKMLKKKEIVVLTKADILSGEDLKRKLANLKKLSPKAMALSIYDLDSLEKLISLLGKA